MQTRGKEMGGWQLGLWLAVALLVLVPLLLEFFFGHRVLVGNFFLLVAAAFLALWARAGIAVYRWLRSRLASASYWWREIALSGWLAAWFMPGAVACGAAAIGPLLLLLLLLLAPAGSDECRIGAQLLRQVCLLAVTGLLILLLRQLWAWWQGRRQLRV